MIWAKVVMLVAWIILWWLRSIHRKNPNGMEIIPISILGGFVGYIVGRW